jgi:hypothetical protein
MWADDEGSLTILGIEAVCVTVLDATGLVLQDSSMDASASPVAAALI